MQFIDHELDGAVVLKASCLLDGQEMRLRLAEWRALRERCAWIRRTDDGAVLSLAATEPLPAVLDLMDRESECCGFYRFTVRVTGDARELEVDAGPGGFPAVAALLSLD